MLCEELSDLQLFIQLLTPPLQITNLYIYYKHTCVHVHVYRPLYTYIHLVCF